MAEPSGKSVDYEMTDAEPRLVAALAAGIAAFLVLSPLALQFAFPNSLQHTTIVGHSADIPPPRLQIDPRQDATRFRAAENKKLSSYGWANGKRTAVHVPIDRALELTLERGLPGWRKP
jgi:hypothetical protein